MYSEDGIEIMAGETDLAELVRAMKPKMRQIELVFCTIPWKDLPEIPLDPLLLFKELEGVTMVMPKREAKSLGLPTETTWSWIELTVHSSLNAVGFLSIISKTLADAGISLNVISAYYHDHLFVPDDRAKEAIKVLEKLSKEGI
ncbi:MAG: ACT domain-containing protein [Candidatus Thorarchaeota archaeon]|nr:ACT domain-containing protein [Candidatus Thorarchaeota archaeon]